VRRGQDAAEATSAAVTARLARRMAYTPREDENGVPATPMTR
jgi:hypothetical protein